MLKKNKFKGLFKAANNKSNFNINDSGKILEKC